jgi:NitT/TauT family transport system substrate-binding protein
MRTRIFLLILAGFILFTAVILLSTRGGRRQEAPPERVVIGASRDPLSAPVFVAFRKGFFREEGLDASLLLHSTGKASLRSVENGRALFATIADTVLMFAGMERKPILAIATLADSSKHHRIIGLASRGIRGADDLRGKTIGVPKGTSAEFFLYSFLLFNGISAREVTMADAALENMESMLLSGALDAAAAWPPTVNRLTQKLEQQAVVLQDDSYLMTWNIVGQQEFVTANPGLVRKLLRALLKAENYIVMHSDDSIAITAAACGIDAGLLRREWNNYHFDVRLGEGLLINLEEQARWAMKIYYPERKTTPDFTSLIDTRGLRSVDPDAVALRGRPES